MAIRADGTVYVKSDDGKLYALNPDGTQHWAIAIGSGAPLPAISADGIIYVGDFDHTLYGIKPDGTQTSAFSASDTSVWSPVIGMDRKIYVGASRHLLAFNAAGVESWAFPTGS